MEDLDSLLADLGRPKSSVGSKPGDRKSVVSVNRVDMDELESLMEDLAAPAPKAVPAAQPVSAKGLQDELESLMSSLNTANGPADELQPAAKDPVPEPEPPKPEPTQPSEPTPTPAPAEPKADEFDKLFDNLKTQIDSVDASDPNSRGKCAYCGGGILGEMITALGKTYHVECFICGSCHKPIGTSNFYEHKSDVLCEPCYQNICCPKCAVCTKPILDRCVQALNKKYHVECFVCVQCLKPFPDGRFFERDGKPYCEKDFFDVFAPKCGRCQEPIKTECISALGKQWHPACFSCMTCNKAFDTGVFFEFGGAPYCEQHYHSISGSLCGGCNKPITGKCVNAMDKKWHPEHFVCSFCMNPLGINNYKEQNDKAYCSDCHGKLYGS